MATEISAYKFRLWDIRFHEVDLDVPGYDEQVEAGRVRIETTLNFGMDDDALFCTVMLDMDLIKGKEGELSEDSVAASP